DDDIYVMNADGTNATNLTNHPNTDGTPDWSPDGTRIAFQSDRDGDPDIFVMNADGSNPVRLTDDFASDTDPAWSPDGTRIAFQSDREGEFDIFVMNADGSGQTRLTSGPVNGRSPDWQPFTAPPTPTPAPGLWGDNDCNGAVAAVDALKTLQEVAGLPYGQTEPCFAFGSSVGVSAAGLTQRTWGDIDCDLDVDSVDALGILRSIAALPANQQPGCPSIGSAITVAP
ncbi:MAG: TolB family protein, partial [Dehalococcoidia bacterium]